jgi:hypothetical protein
VHVVDEPGSKEVVDHGGTPPMRTFPAPMISAPIPGANSREEGVVDAAGAAGLAEPLAPPPGNEHPVVQPFAGVAERCVVALTLTGGETVERRRCVGRGRVT